MNAQQLTAFQQAAGASADNLSLTIRLLLMSVLFVWAAWMLYDQIRALDKHRVAWFDIILIAMQVAIILLVMGWIVS